MPCSTQPQEAEGPATQLTGGYGLLRLQHGRQVINGQHPTYLAALFGTTRFIANKVWVQFTQNIFALENDFGVGYISRVVWSAARARDTLTYHSNSGFISQSRYLRGCCNNIFHPGDFFVFIRCSHAPRLLFGH